MGLRVEYAEDGRIEAKHTVSRMGHEVGSVLRIEHTSAAWLADQIDGAINDDSWRKIKKNLGADVIEVELGGRQTSPTINIDNSRAGDYSFVGLRVSEAEKLRDELRRLVASG